MIEQSIECYEKSIKIEPNNVYALYNMACMESKMNNWEKSVKFLKKAIELDKKCKIDARDDPDSDNKKLRKEFKDLLE